MARKFALATLVAGVFLALTAQGVGAAPLVDRGHDSGTDTFPDNICGIDGTSTASFVDNFQTFADNTFKDQFEAHQTFTSALTGKSVDLHVADQASGPNDPVDNGDGTFTFTVVFKGLPEHIKLANGGMLTRDAGNVTLFQTFDANGNFLFQTFGNEKGPHPDLESGFAIFCDVIVPALS
jgi:hypothetical protein